MAARCGPTRTPYTADLSEEESLFKALADQHRLRIIATIARSGGEVCVCDLTDVVPLLQPTVSHHLKVLREAGLLLSERRGTWVYYRIDPRAQQRIDTALQRVIRPKTKLGRAG
jgi:ArsR family transcriptional regulator